jgi:ankyrin repeat protein
MTLASCVTQKPSTYLWEKDFEGLKKRVLENPDFIKRTNCKEKYCPYYNYFSVVDYLAMYNFYDENKDGELLKFLLDNGAEIDNESFTNYYINPLYRALYQRRNIIAKILIDNGARIENIDYRQYSALMVASVQRNNKDMIEYILKKGGKPNSINKYSETALEKALQVSNNAENIDVLLNNGAIYKPKFDLFINSSSINNLKVLTKHGISVLYKNAYGSYYTSKTSNLSEKLKKYFKPINADLTLEGNDYLRTIHELILNSDNIFSKKIIDLCLAQNKDCKKYLDSFTYFGFSPIVISMLKNDNDLIEYLIKSGADVNLKNKFNQTALHIAIIFDNEETINVLLKNNADIQIKDIMKNSPQDLYAKYHGGDLSILQKKLLEEVKKDDTSTSLTSTSSADQSEDKLGNPKKDESEVNKPTKAESSKDIE